MNQFNKEIAQALLENTNLTEVFRNGSVAKFSKKSILV